MAFQHVVIKNLHAANRTHQFAKTYVGNGIVAREIPVPDSSVDLEVEIAISLAGIQNLFMVCDQDITVDAINDGVPDTIELKANVPLIWNADEALQMTEIPLTRDVIAFFLTTGAVGDCTFICEVLQNSTPGSGVSSSSSSSY